METKTQPLPSDKSMAAQPPVKFDHPAPSTVGKTAAEYTYEAMRLHNEQYKNQGKPPPAILRWMGDGALAVLPMNRMFCAIGLTAGLMAGGTLGKIATGYTLSGEAVAKADVPTFLQGIHKIVKNYNGPKALDSRSRWVKYAQWGIYSLGGALGVAWGTNYAYKNVAKIHKDPHYLEDYTARVSMHQGGTWTWLAAFSGIFGSASGLWMLPIPGLNYALGLAGRTTSMQDRNFMISGLNSMMSGATTPSYLRLKEGLNYMCYYAVGNPAQTPSQFEFLAYTLLGPVFKDQLTPEHIKKFTDAMHAVRDQYWEEGGIPKEKRQEALYTMKEVFTGAGLEVLLIDMGLNPGTIAFDKLNGMTGAIGNVGARQQVLKEQEAYLTALQSRLPIYVKDGELEQADADWVVAGIKAAKEGKLLPPPPPEPAPNAEKEETPAARELADGAKERFQNKAPATYSDRMNNEAKKSPNVAPKEKRLVDRALEDKRDWSEIALGQKQNKENVPLID